MRLSRSMTGDARCHSSASRSSYRRRNDTPGSCCRRGPARHRRGRRSADLARPRRALRRLSARSGPSSPSIRPETRSWSGTARRAPTAPQSRRRCPASTSLRRHRVNRGTTTWQSPVEVGRPGVGNRPRVAINDAGSAAILWVHDIGDDRVVQAKLRPGPSGAWPNANDLSGTPREVRNHAIGLDGAGDAVAVWAHATPPPSTSSARPASPYAAFGKRRSPCRASPVKHPHGRPSRSRGTASTWSRGSRTASCAFRPCP
jgi:hypothetical protein